MLLSWNLILIEQIISNQSGQFPSSKGAITVWIWEYSSFIVLHHGSQKDIFSLVDMDNNGCTIHIIISTVCVRNQSSNWLSVHDKFNATNAMVKNSYGPSEDIKPRLWRPEHSRSTTKTLSLVSLDDIKDESVMSAEIVHWGRHVCIKRYGFIMASLILMNASFCKNNMHDCIDFIFIVVWYKYMYT